MSFPNHSFNDPYQPPQFSGQMPPPQQAGRPGIWIGYAIYCIFLALIYTGAVVLGVVFILFAEPLAESDAEANDPATFVVFGFIFCVTALPFLVAFLAGPFVPRNRFGWIYSLILIVIGLTSGCTIVFSIPLLIFWLQDDIKRFYGVK